MPLINSFQPSEQCVWGIWQIVEDETTLLELLSENTDRYELNQIVIPQRRLQWLAARVLVRGLSEQIADNTADGTLGNSVNICKDEYGKPMLENSTWHISFAHCSLYAVVILHKTKPVGIDIEQISPKISRVIARVCTSEELEWAEGNLAKFAMLWCGKEALYKLYGKKKLDFKREINISENASKGIIITSEDTREVALLHSDFLENYQITACL